MKKIKNQNPEPKPLDFDEMNKLSIPVKLYSFENGKAVGFETVQLLVEWGRPEEDIYSITKPQRA